MNNPLSMVDPTGMYAWSVGLEGGGASDGWQAQQRERLSQFQQTAESEKNFYLLIRNAEEVGEFFERTTDMGTFHILIASSMSSAQSKVSKTLGKNKMSTMVIDSHGAERGGVITTDASSNRGVNGAHMEAYNSNSQACRLDRPENYNQIRALENLINLLDDDGSTCVFMTCGLAKGENGSKFIKAIGLMAASKNTTFYFNQDWSNPLNSNDAAKSLQIWQGPYGISKQYLNLGWVKMMIDYRGYQIINLKSSNKTGDIYLDSRPGMPTVTEIPR